MLHTFDHHPVIANKITRLRDNRTGNREFRELVSEISTILAYEATRNDDTIETQITTPICETKGKILYTMYAIISILRAGEGMVNGVHNFLPFAKVGHVGIFRNPSDRKPVRYYEKMPPDIYARTALIVDPMLATGGTLDHTIKLLKEVGCKSIKALCIVSATSGVKRIKEAHPDVTIYTAACDSVLNDHGYIVPGLGDAGDRLYGTK